MGRHDQEGKIQKSLVSEGSSGLGGGGEKREGHAGRWGHRARTGLEGEVNFVNPVPMTLV